MPWMMAHSMLCHFAYEITMASAEPKLIPLLTYVFEFPAILLSVGDPDIFYLDGVFEEQVSFALCGAEPVEGAAIVGPDLFQVSDGERLRLRAGSLVAEAPDG